MNDKSSNLNLKLNLFAFNIPSVSVGREITYETLSGAEKTLTTMRNLLTAQTTGLVGADGKPLLSANAETPLVRLTRWVDEMLSRPPLRKSYGVNATTGTLNTFDPTSSNLAVMVYTQLADLLEAHLGRQVLEVLGSQLDAVLLLLLQNLGDGRNPRILLEAVLHLTVADPKTGAPLVGSAQERGLRYSVLSVLLGFLVVQGMITTTIEPHDLESVLAREGDTGDVIVVTDRGRRLYHHLLDALSLKLSLRKSLSELAQASPTETKTASEIEADSTEGTSHV